jgi:phytoene/squalene synthetase
MAAHLLGRDVRPAVESIYGLVRVADEIVDGAAAEAGLDLQTQRTLLDALETETERTLLTGYSTNLIVHAFGTTARAVGIGNELTRPFFAAMRRDLDETDFTVDGVRE